MARCRFLPLIERRSEIFQITGPIARSAAMLAGHGYVVVVPEVYHEFLEPGKVLRYVTEDTQLGNKLKTDKELASYDSDSAAAVSFLQSNEHCTGAVGMAGFCLGGALAFRAALNPAVKSCACWYATDLHKGGLSTGDDSLARCAELKGRCELLMIFGRQDPHIPGEGRAKIYAALTEAEVKFQWLEVNGQHAFMRDENSYGRYDPELAMLTYQAALQLFARTLH